MSESKAPDFDTYGLLRAMHSFNPTLVSYKLFAIKSFTIPKASLSRLFGTVRG